MKKIILLTIFFCVLGFTAESALPRLDKAASSAKVNSASSNTSNSTLIDNDSSEVYNSPTSSTANVTQTTAKTETGLATLPNGKAYVGVASFLSLRDEPFGTVLAHLNNNDEVIIVSRNGDWYEIESDKGSGWVYGKCIFDSPNSNKSNTASDTAYIAKDTNTDKSSDIYEYTTFNNPGDYTLQKDTKTSDSQKKTTNTKTKTTTKKTTTAKKSTSTKKSSGGTLQSKIVNAAKEVVKKYSKSGSFPYLKRLQGGKIGCAYVATTVLKKAGALKKTSTGCKQTIGLLKQAGWKKVKVPPYKAGDVIFWTQTNKKKSKGPTHVGIIMQNGNNVQAMSNSSKLRKPRYHKANYQKLYCVMRKA